MRWEGKGGDGGECTGKNNAVGGYEDDVDTGSAVVMITGISKIVIVIQRKRRRFMGVVVRGKVGVLHEQNGDMMMVVVVVVVVFWFYVKCKNTSIHTNKDIIHQGIIKIL